MLLSRQNYLAIAGVSLEFFKSLQRRNQVPLLGSSLEGLKSKDEVEAVKFFDRTDKNGYLPEEALMLAIADHMVTQNSFSRPGAKRLMEGWWNVLLTALPRIEGGEDIWYLVGSWDFGHEKLARVEDPNDRAHWSFVETGTFDEVIAFIRDEQAEQKQHNGIVDNIAMFNLSVIVRKAHERAADNSLAVAFFSQEAAL